MAYAKDTRVVQVQPEPIRGTVVAYSVDQNTGEVQYLVEWDDAFGTTHSRYFTEAEITPV